MLTPQEQSDYDYFIEDFKTWLGCPQCEAEQRLEGFEGTRGTMGFKLACHEVLLKPHECGKKEE